MGGRVARQPNGQLDGRWILVVDDEPAVLFMVEKILEANGAVCRAATSHADALRAAASESRLEVAILDFSMPDGDGCELVPKLLAVRPEMVVVGNSGTDRRQEFHRLGDARTCASVSRRAGRASTGTGGPRSAREAGAACGRGSPARPLRRRREHACGAG